MPPQAAGVLCFVSRERTDQLKKAAMLFDTILVWRVSQIVFDPSIPGSPLQRLTIRRLNPEIEATTDWLESNGIATNIDSLPEELCQAAHDAYLESVIEARSLRYRSSKFFLLPSQLTIHGEDLLSDRMSSRFAVSAADQFDGTLIPLLRSSGSQRYQPEDRSRAELLRAVIAWLPLPAEETPWEAILDFRRDPDAQMKYRRLRATLTDLARGGGDSASIIERIATLVDDYEQYMRLQHLKIGRSRLEILLTAAAEVLEDMAHMRFSTAVKRMFAVRSAKIGILEAELSAPGREVAYLAAAKNVLLHAEAR